MSSHHGRGFTLVELLVVVAIVAVMAALLVPAASSLMNYVSRVTCANRLHHIGVAYASYKADSKQPIPLGFWQDRLARYTDSPKMFRCPEGGAYYAALDGSDFGGDDGDGGDDPPSPPDVDTFVVVDDGWRAMPHNTRAGYHGGHSKMAGVIFRLEPAAGGTNVYAQLSP